MGKQMYVSIENIQRFASIGFVKETRFGFGKAKESFGFGKSEKNEGRGDGETDVSDHREHPPLRIDCFREKTFWLRKSKGEFWFRET